MSESTACAGRRRDRGVAVITVVIAAAAVLSGVQSWGTQHRLESSLRCQAEVNNELRERIAARDPANTEQLKAQLELLRTPPGDPERGRAAIAKYVQGLTNALESRAANPFPTRNC